MNLEILIEFFKNQTLLYLNPVIYSSLFIARVTYRLLKSMDFKSELVLEFFAKAGKRIKAGTVKAICTQAEKGIDHLEKWLQDKLEDLDVNEVTTEIMANQTTEIGDSFDRAGLADPKRLGTAKHIEDGMEQMGGASQAIAPSLSEAMLDPKKRDLLSSEIQQKLDQYHELSMVARRNSLIKNSKQIVSGGTPVRMEMIAEDNSKIISAEQRVKTIRRKNNPEK